MFIFIVVFERDVNWNMGFPRSRNVGKISYTLPSMGSPALGKSFLSLGLNSPIGEISRFVTSH